MREIGVGVAVHDGHTVRDGADHLCHVDFNAARVATLGARQMVNQHPITTADGEHARTWRDQLGDPPENDAHILGDEADGIVSSHGGGEPSRSALAIKQAPVGPVYLCYGIATA